MDFDRVRSEYSILTIMAKLGCDMTHKGYMYKAPFREDRTSSMHAATCGATTAASFLTAEGPVAVTLNSSA